MLRDNWQNETALSSVSTVYSSRARLQSSNCNSKGKSKKKKPYYIQKAETWKHSDLHSLFFTSHKDAGFRMWYNNKPKNFQHT